MTNPGGKKRRFRRSFESPSWQEEPPVAGESTAVAGGTREGATTHCQRCELPLIGEVCGVGIRAGEVRRQFQLCEPCVESLNRWLIRPRRESQRPKRETGASRLRPTEVIDALATRRRNKDIPSKHHETVERRRLMYQVIGSVVTVALFAIIMAVAFVLTNDSSGAKDPAADAPASGQSAAAAGSGSIR